jgi:predicted NAD/FAD-binding protein
MLELSTRPQWQTVVGGSHSYIRAFKSVFKGTIKLSTPATRISRTPSGVSLRLGDGSSQEFDKVVLATHADEALALLADPTEHEREALGSWNYSVNRTVLHTDSSVLAPAKRLWAAWNYRRRVGAASDSPVAITYYMNKLQRLKAARDYFVTLNCGELIDPDKILYQTVYTHPIYTPESPRSQALIRARNGENNTYFCGAYMRHGFHEDAVQSALDVVGTFGLSL